MKSIKAILGKDELEFPLLSAEELGDLTQTVPNAVDVIDVYALAKWARHPVGCSAFLLMSRRKLDAGVKPEDVKSYGSIMQRIGTATRLLDESLGFGALDPNAGGEQSP
jgi:hypothetical protein